MTNETSAPPEGEGREPERHASWPELFFDLVVVAGAGLLAHLLEHGQGVGALFLFAVAFGAFWMIWACFTAYGNLRGDQARFTTLLWGMAVLSVMVAAVPHIHDDHAQAFAIAYIVGRIVAARPWHGVTVVVDLPVLQAAAGVLPWIISLWVEGDVKYVLWAVGLTLDLIQLLRNNSSEAMAQAQRRLDRYAAKVSRHEEKFEERIDALERDRGKSVREHPRVVTRREQMERRAAQMPSSIVALRADGAHLTERLSLFTLILLGEGLIQLLTATSEAVWDRALLAGWAGGFAFLVALWLVAVDRGSAGVALLPDGALPVRLQWIAHLVTSLCLVAMAAVMGDVVAAPAEGLEGHSAAILAGAFALYTLGAASLHLVYGVRRNESVSRVRGVALAVTGSAASLTVWLGHEAMVAWGAVWVLALAILACAAVDWRARERHAQ